MNTVPFGTPRRKITIMFNASVRIAVAMLLLALTDFVLPQLWAAPDAGEPRVIADFRPALEGATEISKTTGRPPWPYC